MSEFSKEKLLNYMGRRYDYYSARIHYREALSHASISDKNSFSQAEIGSFCTALEKSDAQLETMLSSIRIWVGLQEPETADEPSSAEAPEPATEVKAEPAPEVKAEPAPEVKAEPAHEVKAEPAPEVKAEPKPALVAEPKPVTQSEISVAVRSVPFTEGQRLVMTGDGEVFGDWDLGKSLVLEADSDGVWRATLTQKVGATLTFKFVLTADDGAVWEDGDNRQFVVPAESTSTFETEWQVAQAA